MSSPPDRELVILSSLPFSGINFHCYNQCALYVPELGNLSSVSEKEVAVRLRRVFYRIPRLAGRITSWRELQNSVRFFPFSELSEKMDSPWTAVVEILRGNGGFFTCVRTYGEVSIHCAIVASLNRHF